MSKKKSLGQFYTTNYRYIFQNMVIPTNVSHIIEPFTGNADLLQFLGTSKQYYVECYDIEPKQPYTIKQDTIKNPPDYKNKFIITNPPYLARNKSSDKSLFDKYDVNDLYKCFLKELITNQPIGGIVIVPLNFWSSIRKNDVDLRKQFLKTFSITNINVFEERVFDDTAYTVCCFQFELRQTTQINLINITFYPSKETIQVDFNEQNNYIIGGKIYLIGLNSKYTTTRLTRENIQEKNTNILAKCIDNRESSRIALSYISDETILHSYIDTTPKLSSRSYAVLVIKPEIDESKQKLLIQQFNQLLDVHRKTYHSLFLTNYRESTDISRKRISFNLIYQIVNYVLGLM
jgi:hypothetical protein